MRPSIRRAYLCRVAETCPRCGTEREFLVDDRFHALRCAACGQTVSWSSAEHAHWLREELAAE